MNQKVTEVGKPMGGIRKTQQEEFNKSMSSAAQGIEARAKERAKDHAIPFKSDVKAKLPPCLNFGADGRKLGLGPKRNNRQRRMQTKRWKLTLTQYQLKRKSRPNISKRNKRRGNGEEVSMVRMFGGAV